MDGNVSINRDHAVKSVIDETENDPVFQKFLVDVFGKVDYGDSSPNEDLESGQNQESSEHEYEQ